MQSLRLLHELNAYTGNNPSSPTKPPPRAICQSFIDGQEEAIEIDVKIFPSTSLTTKLEEKENVVKDKSDKMDGGKCCQKKKEAADDGGEFPLERKNEEEGWREMAKLAKEETENEITKMEREEEEEEEEEKEREYTEEELARIRRRMLFPTETINEMCMFLPFGDCNRQYTTSRLLQALLEPRRKVCMEMFIKRLDATRERLNQTIKEKLKDVDERRRHVNELSEHIGTINVRLAEMGDHLAELDAQILDNHSKLDELHARIERMRAPMANLSK